MLQIFFDTAFYGRVVAAPLNIIAYNMFTSHGPDLYGTEPWHFYFLNGILNFNIVFLLSLVAWPGRQRKIRYMARVDPFF